MFILQCEVYSQLNLSFYYNYFIINILLVVGGLLSAHLLAPRAGVTVEEGWPCQGPLLRLAVDAAERLLPG